MQFLEILGGGQKVILTTAYSEYALKGYEYDVVDYLLKPFSFDRFLKAAQKVLNLLSQEPEISSIQILESISKESVWVKTETKGKMLKIDLRDIYYIEGLKNYVSIFTSRERIISLLNIKYLEQELLPPTFFRVHKSYIVALGKIRAIDGNQLVLKVAEREHPKIPIGATYKKAFSSFIKNQILGKVDDPNK